MKEENESVQIIDEKFVDVTGLYYGGRGSHDYSRKGIDIDTVIDSTGHEVKMVWKDQWNPVAPGIETGVVNGTRTVRIHREVCPVRVRFREYWEYVSYDYSEHNSNWETFYWLRYESNL